MNEAIKKSITEKDVKDHYKPEIKASHILVSDENEAKEIKSKLDAGASFEELAKQESQDLLSKDKGGDLDTSIQVQWPLNSKPLPTN